MTFGFRIDVLSDLCNGFSSCNPQLLNTYTAYKHSLPPATAAMTCPCAHLPAVANSLASRYDNIPFYVILIIRYHWKNSKNYVKQKRYYLFKTSKTSVTLNK